MLKERALQYTWDRVAEELESAYEKAIGSVSGRK
jgi:hypothetical protein